MKESFAGRAIPLTAWILIVVATLFALLWLSEIVPDLLAGHGSTSAGDYRLPTNPVHVLDLAIFLPSVLASGVLVLRQHPLGYATAPGQLVFLALTSVPIVITPLVADARGHAAGWAVVPPIGVLLIGTGVVLWRTRQHTTTTHPPNAAVIHDTGVRRAEGPLDAGRLGETPVAPPGTGTFTSDELHVLPDPVRRYSAHSHPVLDTVGNRRPVEDGRPQRSGDGYRSPHGWTRRRRRDLGTDRPTPPLRRHLVRADADHITAHHQLGTTPVEMRLQLDPQGQIRSLVFDRWSDPDQTGTSAWNRFGGNIIANHSFAGLTIPSAGQLGWHFGTDSWATGEFFRYEITGLEMPSPSNKSPA